MQSIDRRAFIGMSLGGIAAAATQPAFSSEDVPPGVGAGGRPDTLMLTWRSDPTTTITVQWIGPARTFQDAAVWYAPISQATWQSVATGQQAYPLTDLQRYRAELTGLSPSTEYRLKIGRDPTVFRFRTMPAKATNAFQFVSGGDCGVDQYAVANNILAAKQDPMFALIGGDIAYDDGLLPDVSLQFVRNYSRHMVDSQGRLIPMVVCIGNHDLQGEYGMQRQDAPFFFSLHDGLFAERSYATLDFGDYLSLVLLDTGHVAPIGGEQADWLDKSLAERTDRPHLYVVNHVPAYPSRPNSGDKNEPDSGEMNRQHWVPLFEKHNVDLVLEHHDHAFSRTHPLKNNSVDKNGLVYLGDGSWGKMRSTKAPDNRPYLAFTDESCHLSVHRLEGQQCFHLTLSDAGRIVDACQTSKRPRRSTGRG